MIRSIFLALCLVVAAQCADYVHNPIQYHSQTDKGSYNFGYDTGLFGSHQFHQESKAIDGTVHGRYGYTDPDGKLRLVNYRAGKDIGYEVIKDVSATEPAPKPIPTPDHVHVHAIHSPHIPSRAEIRASYRSAPRSHVHEKVYVVRPDGPIHNNCGTPNCGHKVSSPAEHAHHHTHHRYHDSHSPSKTVTAVRTEVIRPVVLSQPIVVHAPVVTKVAAPRIVEPVIVQQHAEPVTKTFYSPIETFRGKASPRSAPPPVIKGVASTRREFVGRYPPAGKYSRCWCE